MDVFDTAALRERVLAAWAASVSRFREDANAEEELVRGAYRDRVIVELAQNAADAASRAGAPARLLLRLHGSTLVAANTGAPLDATGVEGLATLRASTKRDDDIHDGTVGRFGVGFAAVLAVTDAPAVVTRSGGVRWSRDDTRREASQVPVLADELVRRGDAVPVLRLPFPADAIDMADQPFGVPAGYDTAVVLSLRDDDAQRLVRGLLAEVDETLLLALPNLAEIVVDVDGTERTLRAEPAVAVVAAEPSEADDSGTEHPAILQRRIDGRLWRLGTVTGTADPALLADRPFEERARPAWAVTVAVPVDATGRPEPVPPGVLHAPTPTDDATDLSVLVLASWPLDSTRRRVAPGPLTQFLARRVADAYAALITSFVPGSGDIEAIGPAVLELVPGPVGVGELDGAVHRAIRSALAVTPFVPATDGARLRPDEVVLVDGLAGAADPCALGAVVAGMPGSGWRRRDVLAGLGATVTPLADVVDEFARLDLAPYRWREVYAALDGADPEALGALPVPLADGRVVRGPRGLLLPGEVPAELMEPFDLRVVDADAAHPLLRRLGAVEATADAVLRDPLVRAAITDAAENDDVQRVSDAVLGLVAEAAVTVDDEPWLGEVLLPDQTGTDVPARELFLPDAVVLPVLDADPAEYTVDAALVSRFGVTTLAALGVRAGFDAVRDADVALDDDLWHDLDDEEAWSADVSRRVPGAEVPPVVAEFVGIRDLDLVRDDSWAQVLDLLAAAPQTRSAVVEPTLLVLADGTRLPVPSYAAWWLRRHARLDGYRLTEVCADDAEPVVRALLHPVRLAVDDTFASAMGAVTSLDVADTGTLLDRLANDAVTLDVAHLAEVYAVLADRDPDGVESPGRVRIPSGTGTRVVPASRVVVCDAPYWLQLDLPGTLPGPARLADLLDVNLAAEVTAAELSTGGRIRDVPVAALAIQPQAPTQYVEHDDLRVGGVPVDWWIEDGTVHACTLDGLGRGLAWVSGRWDQRWVLAEVLRDPTTAGALLIEDAFR